jgi:hypothetical protein
VSIIVENDDNFRRYCPTRVSASSPSSNFQVKNEEDDIYGETTEEEMDEEEREKLGDEDEASSPPFLGAAPSTGD